MTRQIEFLTNGKPLIVLEREDGRVLRLDFLDYALLLREAKRNGWEPEGFVKVSYHGDSVFNSDLESDYLFPQRGWISDRDARNIANALRKVEIDRDQFLNRDVFQVEFYPFNEICDFDMEEFLISCSLASDVIPSMGGFIVIQPRNLAEYLLSKKKNVLKDFIGFCELGEFRYMQIINEWLG